MKVLVYINWAVKAWSIPDQEFERLRTRFPRIEFVQCKTLNDAHAAIGDVDVVFAPRLTAEMIADAHQLRWVHSSAVAVEGMLPLAALAQRGVTVTNSPTQGVPIAESVMGGLLVLARKYHKTLEAQRERRWIWNELADDWPWTLHGKRMTLIGLGSIGVEIARRAQAFGIEVTAVRRHADRGKPRGVTHVFGNDRLDQALDARDLLVIAAPGVAGTQGMIGPQQLDRLALGAIVVNIARSVIVDSQALIARLESGRLGGAVLDVFDHEPLEPDSPFWSLSNVIVTPHSSGFRGDHFRYVVDLFADNLRRFQRGQPLRAVVDTVAGY